MWKDTPMASFEHAGDSDRVTGSGRAITIRELPRRRPLQSARRPHGPPLAVTDRALEKLESILDKQRRRASQALGLVIEPGGTIGLVLDEPEIGVVLFVRKARPVLFVTTEAAARLAGYVLDVAGADSAGRFTLLAARE